MEAIERMACELMDQHGLLDKGWYFSWDNAKRRAGCCFYNLKRISLSKPIAQGREINMTRNTILHEIAHALVGSGHGHDSVWRRKALEIGCDGNRCYSDFKLQGKWIATCAHGKIFHRHKRPSGRSSCACEGKTFNSNSILIWEQNTQLS